MIFDNMAHLIDYIAEKLKFSKEFHVEDENDLYDVEPDDPQAAKKCVSKLNKLAKKHGLKITLRKPVRSYDFCIMISDINDPPSVGIAYYTGNYSKSKPNFQTCYSSVMKFIEKYDAEIVDL